MKRYLFLAFVNLMFFMSCLPKKVQSDVEHTSGDIFITDHKIRWVEISRAEMIEHLQLMEIVPTGESFLPETNAVHKRVQKLIDLIHSTVLKKKDERSKLIPPPKALVWKNDVVNAFVAPIRACFNAKQVGRDSRDATDAEPVELTPRGETGRGHFRKCIDLNERGYSAKSFTDYINNSYLSKHVNVGCKVTEGRAYFSVGNLCAGDIASTEKFAELAIWSTPNFVVVNTGIIKELSESEFLSVLAHELAHYYQSHPSVSDEDVNFFYQAGTKRVKGRPVEAPPALQQIGKRLQATSRSKYHQFFSWNEAKLMYAPEVYEMLIYDPANPFTEYIKAHCRPTDTCAKPCAAFTKFRSRLHLEKDANNKPRSFFAFHDTSEYPVIAKAADKELLECGKVLPADSIELGNLFAHLDETPENEKANVGEYLAELTSMIRQQALRHKELSQKAVEANLVYYSKEEEADEISAEVLWRVGVEVDRQIEAMFTLLKVTERQMREAKIEVKHQKSENWHDECRRRYENHFKDPETGKEIVPLRGKFDDPHNAICFRIYAIIRENAEHGYTVREPERRKFEDVDWKSVQNAVRGMKASKKNLSPSSNAMVRKLGLNCALFVDPSSN